MIRDREQYFVSVVKVLTWINMTRSEFRWLSVVSHQPQYQITCILSTMLCHVKCRSHSVNYIVRFVRRRNYNFGESRFSKEKSHTNGKIKFRQTFRSMLNKYVQISWWCINTYGRVDADKKYLHDTDRGEDKFSCGCYSTTSNDICYEFPFSCCMFA